MGHLRLVASGLCLSISLAAFSYQHTGTFAFGYAVGGALAAMFALVAIVVGRRASLPLLLWFPLFTGTSYAVGMFVLAPSLIGVDPQAHSVQIQWLMARGSTAALPDGFYQTAAGFHVLSAIVAFTTGLRADSALVAYTLSISLSVPLFTGVIVRRLEPSLPVRTRNLAAGIAALLSAVAASTTYYSIGPVAQIISVPLVLAVVFASLRYIRSKQAAFLGLGLMAIVALMFVHKLPLAILTGGFIIGAVLAHQVGDSHEATRLSGFALFTIILLALQWAIVTAFASEAVMYGLGLVEEAAEGNLGTEFGETNLRHSEAVVPTLAESLIRRSHLLLFACGGLSSIGLIVRLTVTDSTAQGYPTILGITGATGALVSAAILTGFMGFSRPLIFAEVFTAIAVAIGVALVLSPESRYEHNFRTSHISVAIILLLAVLIIPQFTALTAVPDQPDTPRQYLTQDEIDAKEYHADHVPGTVWSDRYYAHHTPNPKTAVNSGDRASMETVANPWLPGILTTELLDGTLLEHDYQYIAYRTNVDIYRFSGLWAQLTWDPETALEYSCDSIYSNGGVSTYDCS